MQYVVCTQNMLGLYFRDLKFLGSSFPKLGILFPGSSDIFSSGLLFLWSFSRKLYWQSQLFLGEKSPRKLNPRIFSRDFFLRALQKGTVFSSKLESTVIQFTKTLFMYIQCTYTIGCNYYLYMYYVQRLPHNMRL